MIGPQTTDSAEKLKHRGAGDTVAAVLKSVGIKKRKGCGCGRRQRKLNDAVPYSWSAWKWRLFWPVLWLFRRR